jgi:hypothetical protein
LVALVIVSSLVAFLEARSVWHYVLWPPSLESGTGPWSQVTAVSQIDFTGGLLQPMTKQQMTERAAMCKQAPERCGNSSWVLVRALDAGMSAMTPDIADEILKPVFNDELSRQRTAEWRSGQWTTIRPARGLAVQFQSDGNEWLLIEYSSDRGLDNRYSQIETLYRLARPRPVLISNVHYFFDGDRLPQLWVSVLCEVNLLLLLAGALLARFSRTQSDGIRLFASIPIALLIVFLASYFSYTTIARFDPAFTDIGGSFVFGAVINSVLPVVSLFYSLRNYRLNARSSSQLSGSQ